MSPPDVKRYMGRARRDLSAADSNIQQGFYDVAVTHAYYAMFYAASAGLASKDIVRSKHSGVQSAFGQHFVKTGLIEPDYSRMLINAFELRPDCDYDVEFTASRTVAEAVLRDGQQFVERMAAFLSDM